MSNENVMAAFAKAKAEEAWAQAQADAAWGRWRAAYALLTSAAEAAKAADAKVAEAKAWADTKAIITTGVAEGLPGGPANE